MGGQESRGMCCMKSAQSLSVSSSSRGGSRLVAVADPTSIPSTYAVTNWRKDESLNSNNSDSITSLRSTKSKTKGSKQSKRPSLNVCTESMNESQQLTVDGCSLSELQLQGERGNPSMNLEQILSDVSTFFNSKPYESTSNTSAAFERAYIQPAEPSELTIYLKNEQSIPSKSKYFTLVAESIHRNVSNLQQLLDLGVPLLSFESQDPFLQDQSDIISGIDSQPLPILQQSHSLQQQPSNNNQIIPIQKLPHKASLDNLVSANQQLPKNIKPAHPTQQQLQSPQLPLSLSQQLSAPFQQTPNPPNSATNINNNDQSKILYSWGDLHTKGILVQVIRSLFQRQHFSKPRELTYVKVMKIIDPNTCLIACQSTTLKQSKLSDLEESDSLNLTNQSKPNSPLKKSIRKTSGSQISSAISNEDKFEKAQLLLSGMLIQYNSQDKELRVSEMSQLDLHIDTSHYVQRQLIIHRQKKQFIAMQTALAK